MDDAARLQLHSELPDDPASLKQLLLAERASFATARLELQGSIDLCKQTLVDRDKRLAERELLIAQRDTLIVQREESIRLLSEDNSLLRHRLSQLLRSSYGPRAERFDPRQLLLFGLRVPPLEGQRPEDCKRSADRVFFWRS